MSEAAASALDLQLGGLYIGMKDCVRAMMCVKHAGRESLGGMCIACYSLGKNRKFRARVSTKLDPLDLDIRFDFLTRPELITRLKLRHNQADFSSWREKHLKQAVRTSKEVIATANDRAVRALNDVRTLLSGLCAASEAATASERQAAKAAVALAQSAQEHAELQAEHTHLQVYSQSSLQAMALATVAVQEEPQAECTRGTVALYMAQKAHATSLQNSATSNQFALYMAQEAHAAALQSLATSNQEQLEAHIDELASELQRVRD